MQSIRTQKAQAQVKGSSLGIFIILAVVGFFLYLGANGAFSFYEEVSTKVYENKGR